MRITSKEGEVMFDQEDVDRALAELELDPHSKDIVASVIFATLSQRRVDLTIALQAAFVGGVLYARGLSRQQKEQRNATS